MSHLLWNFVRDDRDNAAAAKSDKRQSDGVVAGKNEEIFRHGVQYRGHLRHAPRCFLDAHDVIDPCEALYGRRIDVHPGTACDAVKDDGQGDGARDGTIVLVKTFLGWLVVVGRDGKDAIDADGSEFTRERDHFGSVVTSGAGEHRDFSLRDIDGEFHDAKMFFAR